MKLPVVLREAAEIEFDEAFDWYDVQRIGLGAEFAAEVQKVFDRLATNPLIHQRVFADIRILHLLSASSGQRGSDRGLPPESRPRNLESPCLSLCLLPHVPHFPGRIVGFIAGLMRSG